MVSHVYNPSTWEGEAEGLWDCEFEASLDRNPVSKKKSKNKKRQKEKSKYKYSQDIIRKSKNKSEKYI
jgi:hypothetical protein